MRTRLTFCSTTCLAAAGLLAIAPPASAAPGTLREFRLPSSEQEEPTPRPQGPVAPDVPASREVLRPDQPQPQTPAPTSSPRPSIVLPPPPATSAPQRPASRPTAAPPASRPVVRDEAPAPSITPPSPAPAETPLPAEPEPRAVTSPPPLPTASSTPPAAEAPEQERGVGWLLAGLAFMVLAALGAMVWMRRRRNGTASSVTVPTIERPRPISTPETPAPAALPTEDSPALRLLLEPLRLSLTLMNATLSYRLQVANRGTEPLEQLAISADMIAAHASFDREQQLSGPGADAMQLALIEHLAPGEDRLVAGEIRLPFTQITPIRQGRAALLLPLVRFRLVSPGASPLTRTFLVAQPPEQPGSRLQPFRLDTGPRIYARLAQRTFA